MKNKRNNVRKRRTALLLMLLFLSEIVSPTLVMALTGGPSQPEFQDFLPVTTSEMVNPFTGDFSYNLPLLTVPGPNGGYPVNLSYSGDVSMEQEASWVGLGWNLNVGSIVRSLRGVPDDFNGDIIKQEMSHKSDWTLSADLSAIDGELLGFDNTPTPSFGLEYNSYNGIGLRAQAQIQVAKEISQTFTGQIQFGFNTNNGLDAVSYTHLTLPTKA